MRRWTDALEKEWRREARAEEEGGRVLEGGHGGKRGEESLELEGDIPATQPRGFQPRGARGRVLENPPGNDPTPRYATAFARRDS